MSGTVEHAKQSAAERETRRLKLAAGHGHRASGKQRRKGTPGVYGGRRK